MNQSETLPEVQRIVTEVAEAGPFGPETSLQVDSLQALRILMELEKRFDVEIDEVTMFADGWFETPALIATYLDRLRGATALAET